MPIDTPLIDMIIGDVIHVTPPDARRMRLAAAEANGLSPGKWVPYRLGKDEFDLMRVDPLPHMKHIQSRLRPGDSLQVTHCDEFEEVYFGAYSYGRMMFNPPVKDFIHDVWWLKCKFNPLWQDRSSVPQQPRPGLRVTAHLTTEGTDDLEYLREKWPYGSKADIVRDAIRLAAVMTKEEKLVEFGTGRVIL